MIRKQIYLEKRQEQELAKLAALTGGNASALIRAAIDEFVEKQMQITKNRKEHVRKVLDEISGMWADRDDQDFIDIRRSADQRLDQWSNSES